MLPQTSPICSLRIEGNLFLDQHIMVRWESNRIKSAKAPQSDPKKFPLTLLGHPEEALEPLQLAGRFAGVPDSASGGQGQVLSGSHGWFEGPTYQKTINQLVQPTYQKRI